MPELPEVAALAAYLNGRLLGAGINKVQVASIAALKTADPPYYALEGRTVTGVGHYGKFISIDADGLSFVFHLARAGWAKVIESPSPAPLKLGKGPLAARLLFSPADGLPHVGLDLTEAGTHKGLALYVVGNPREVPGIAALGPDPFGPDFDLGAFAAILASSSQQIKGVLRNQSIIAGIGNAYSDEILHAARLSPFAVANKLDAEAVRTLFDAIHDVLGAAILEASGKAPSQLKDSKRSSMRVHGRTGLDCWVCGDTVREVSFADSTLQYCPTCQTKGKILADRRTSKFLK